MLNRRGLLRTAVLAGGWAAAADGQTSATPAKQSVAPEFVVPFIPGSIPDLLARTIADIFGKQEQLTWTVVNKAGAGGNIGAAYVARTDGRKPTLLLSTISHSINHLLYDSIGYVFGRDFRTLVILARSAALLVVRPDSPYQTIGDLLASPRTKAGLTFGSGGIASLAHLAGSQFFKVAQIEATHVPFRGAPESILAVVSGHVDCCFATVRTCLPYIDDRRLRGLVVTSSRRIDGLADVPTTSEILVLAPLTAWYGISVASNEPSTTDQRIISGLADPGVRTAVQSRISTVADEAVISTGAEARHEIASSYSVWEPLVAQAR